MSLVVPGFFETIDLSKPSNLLKVDDFPELTGPTKTILFFSPECVLLTQAPTNKSKSVIKSPRSLTKPSSK